MSLKHIAVTVATVAGVMFLVHRVLPASVRTVIIGS